MTRKAAIVIGTNTTHLLIGDLTTKGSFREVFSRRIITRLGEDIYSKKVLDSTAIKRTLDTLILYSEDIAKYNCFKIKAVATNAVRVAENGDVFVNKVKNETGINLEVISQKEEAYLATKGVFSGLSEVPEEAVIIDIGSGSTEYIYSSSQGHHLKIKGLDIGALNMTERHAMLERVYKGDLEYLKEEVKNELVSVRESLGYINDFIFIGTAGTITQYAALDLNLFPYDPKIVTGHRMIFNNIERIFNDLFSKTIAEIKSIKAMDPGREDLVIAGGLILMESMRLFNKDEITVSDFGLKEGVLLSDGV